MSEEDEICCCSPCKKKDDAPKYIRVKKCTVEPVPQPPPPDPCKLQRIQQKIKAGIKICPPKPIEQPAPPPECLALCIEKIKNPEVKISNEPIVCIVERRLPHGTKIREVTKKTN